MSEGTRQVFNLEQVYAQIGDHYGEIQTALHLPLLDPSASLDEETIFRLGLVTAFQYSESLDDLAAAEATTNRRDWRYALHLPDRRPGFSAPLLCNFRASLYFSAQAASEYEKMLCRLRKMGLFAVRAEVREVEMVVSRVCAITHFIELKRSMKTTLSGLVAADPQWLRANALPHWYERYKTGRLNQPVELSDLEIQKEAVGLGCDIQYLLKTLDVKGKTQLAGLAEIQALTQLLESEFIVTGDQMSWRIPMRTTCNCPGFRHSLGRNRSKFIP